MTNKWTHRYQFKPGRWVFAPTEEAKKAGHRIKRAVESHWNAPDYYFHLRAGGHVAALRHHVQSRYFYRADIDDFFGRVSRSRVTRCLKSWFPYAEAREMASESVVRRPEMAGFVLPYGFVQSPILASVALEMSKLGSLLRSYDTRNDLRVSVYVDDILISADDEGVLHDAARDVEAIADKALFPLSTSKREGPASAITAFNVELSNTALKIADARYAQLKELYQTTTSSYRKGGIVGYVSSINSDQAVDLSR